MSMVTALPEQFGRYRIVRKLGEGGMGAVYMAEDSALGRQIALKVPHFTDADGPQVVERFLREARVAAGIQHPNLCPVYDVGEVNGVRYLTMPLLQGTSLSQLTGRGRPWEPRRAAGLVRKLTFAVGALHQRGLLHRDLKPGNIMLLPEGEPVLLDFGLAKSFTSASRRLTVTGQPVGTPAYMAPEQVTADATAQGPPTDVYALGVILYQLLTGELPFDGPLMAVFAQILHAPPKPPGQSMPGLDPALDGICLKALAKKPEERYARAAAFGQALDAWLSAQPPLPVDAPPPDSQFPVEPLSATAETRVEPMLPVPRAGLVKELTNAIGIRLVLIPAGNFLMGSPPGEEGRAEDEGPEHAVEISRPFYAGAYPVTQEQYQKLMGTNPSSFSSAGNGRDRVRGLATSRFPVERVSWEDADDFCKRLSALPAERASGRVYRLPSEAEWEYACRSGSGLPFHHGKSLASTAANFDGRYPYGGAAAGPYLERTTPVGSYPPNAFGLHDMHGNVWEWCADWYDGASYRDSPRLNPAGPTRGSSRVLRGGSWLDLGRNCRAACRLNDLPGECNDLVGFRIVCVIDPAGS